MQELKQIRPPVTKHIPALDGLRGVAALLVVFSHLPELGYLPKTLFPSGHIGVTVFFTLSGFLMAFLYAKEPFSLRTTADYAISRFSRIAPAYLLVILVCWLIIRFVDESFIFNINNSNILRHLLFSGSVGVFWSIPPEVQFYIFFFAVWYAVYKARSGVYFPTIAVAVASIGMLAFSKGLPGTFLPTKLTFFLFGSIAGLMGAHVRSRFIWPKTALLIQLLLLPAVVSYAYYICTRNYYEVLYSTPSYSILCAMLVFAFSWPSIFTDRLFGSKPLKLLGKLSFAIYLIHVPCLYFGRKLETWGYLGNWPSLIVGLAITFALSGIIHILIERPAQRYLKGFVRIAGVKRKAIHENATKAENPMGFL